MAWRPTNCIIKGVIDNTEQGRVVGQIWIVGREQPIELDLTGDAWPDIAGCKLTFTNPAPEAEPKWAGLALVQSGQVGDITASNKRKVFLVPDHEWMLAQDEGRLDEIPFEIKNCVYLEWFSSANGRVVIEHSKLEVQISERHWETDEDEHMAQQTLNMQAMRDFLDGVIARPTEDLGWEGRDVDEISEDEWEKQLQASDRLATAYEEAMSKFEGDPEARKKEAFVMGWDDLHERLEIGEPVLGDDLPDWLVSDEDDGLDEEDEDEDEEDDAWNRFIQDLEGDDDDDDDDPFGSDDDDDDGEDEDILAGESMPDDPETNVTRAAMRLSDLVMFELNQLPFIEEEQNPESPEDRLAMLMLQMSVKVRASLSNKDSVPRGLTLALLKRCLGMATDALNCVAELEKSHPDYAELWQLIRSTIFEIRDGVVDERRELQ